MELGVVSLKGQTDKITLPDEAFAAEFNEGLVHQVVTAYFAGGRSGNSAQKTRAEVRGGGKKPWKQKGSGRARAGTIRSPIWRTGGVTFAARPQSYEQKVNRKMYRAALRSILSELIRLDRLRIVDEFVLDQPKTRLMLERLKQLDVNTSVLIVTEQFDPTLELAGRNLYDVAIYQANEIGPVHLLQYETVVMTTAALKRFEERLA